MAEETLFTDIINNLGKAKKEGKISGGYRYKDGKLNIGGGYYGDDSMLEIDVNKDGGNILFKKRFKDGGSTNGSGDKAFTGKVKELMDDGYEFGEAVKEAMRQGYVDGGTVDFFKKTYKIKLRGDETAQEIKYLKELMEEFTENIPNLKGKNKLGPYLAGKKSNLQSLAKSYAEYGKENI